MGDKTYTIPDRILRTRPNHKGYETVQIGGKTKLIHRLVAEAFIPNPENLPEINHIDGNKRNNAVSNLEWVSHLENIRHAWDTGLSTPTSLKGEDNPSAKLTEDDVSTIRKRYAAGGVTQAELAREYQVTATAIHWVLTRKNWKHAE